MKKEITAPKDWEIKDRVYLVKGRNTPVVCSIPSRHTRRKPLLWFDEEKGYARELRYATNQRSPLKDEQQGVATLGRIVLRNGQLNVPKRQQALQLMLSVYHPQRGKLYYEFESEKVADNQVDWIEMELKALNLANDMDIDACEAILRVEKGNMVNKMDSREIKRDVLVMARNNPQVFLELATDDNVHLRNIGIKAVEQGIIALSPDNKYFKWASNGRKLFEVPFEQHPYSSLASWFKTDDGLEVFGAIEKRLK